MNNQDLNSANPIPSTPQPEAANSVQHNGLKNIDFQSLKNRFVSELKDLPQKIKQSKFSESRFYKNKMIFWPVTIMFSLVVLTLIIGIIFGPKNNTVTNTKIPTPTPISQNQNSQQTEPTGVLASIEQNLNDLKQKIT